MGISYHINIMWHVLPQYYPINAMTNRSTICTLKAKWHKAELHSYKKLTGHIQKNHKMSTNWGLQIPEQNWNVLLLAVKECWKCTSFLKVWFMNQIYQVKVLHSLNSLKLKFVKIIFKIQSVPEKNTILLHYKDQLVNSV
jgi:hypothetical protein